MNIAILGFGTVGQGIYHVLEQNRPALEALSGEEICLSKILVNDPGKRRGDLSLSKLPLTNSFSDILNDDSIDIVFEVMSDGACGAEYSLQLLAQGKNLISANKAAITAAFFELQETAQKTGVHLRFEAAVAGGVPLLEPLCKIKQLNFISQITGIVNGSSNYILTELNKGRPGEEILAEAKALGMLEEDPTEDIEGYDARRKIAILAAMLLAEEIKEEKIPVIGISSLSAEDFVWARSQKRRLKLIARLFQDNSSYNISVLPTALSESDPLAHVNGVMNQIQLTGDTVGTLSFYGSGGGMFPTAHALWADFIDTLTSKPTYFYRKEHKKENLSLNREAEFYLRDTKDNTVTTARLSVREALSYRDNKFIVIEKV